MQVQNLAHNPRVMDSPAKDVKILGLELRDTELVSYTATHWTKQTRIDQMWLAFALKSLT